VNRPKGQEDKPVTGNITAIDRVAAGVTENAITLARITVEMEAIGKTVASLAKVVRDGNGSSLITRLSLAEARLVNLEKRVEDRLSDVIRDIAALGAKMECANSETVKGKYNILFGVITGVVGIITTLLAVWARGAI